MIAMNNEMKVDGIHFFLLFTFQALRRNSIKALIYGWGQGGDRVGAWGEE